MYFKYPDLLNNDLRPKFNVWGEKVFKLVFLTLKVTLYFLSKNKKKKKKIQQKSNYLKWSYSEINK